jgi:hypothetical protein
VGDATYAFIAIREGEVAILDAARRRDPRHGPGSFLGELHLHSGQTVFVSAVVTKPLRYVAVDRDALRALLFDDGPLSDLVLSTFIARREALQRVQGIGLEIVGPRSMQMLDSRAPTGSRSPGTRRRRSTDPRPRSCGFRAARSCNILRKVRCCARWSRVPACLPARGAQERRTLAPARRYDVDM